MGWLEQAQQDQEDAAEALEVAKEELQAIGAESLAEDERHAKAKKAIALKRKAKQEEITALRAKEEAAKKAIGSNVKRVYTPRKPKEPVVEKDQPVLPLDNNVSSRGTDPFEDPDDDEIEGGAVTLDDVPGAKPKK